MKEKYSKHCTEDRADRITFILIQTGIGNVVFQKKVKDRLVCLTDEGVAVIKAMNGTVITMYYAEMAQARFACEEESIPRAVKVAIQRNTKRGWIIEQNKVRY